MPCARQLVQMALSLFITIIICMGLYPSGAAMAADAKPAAKPAAKTDAKSDKKPVAKDAKKKEVLPDTTSAEKKGGKKGTPQERKSKKFGLQGGAGLLEGGMGVGGAADLFIGKNKEMVLMGGGFYAIPSTTSYMELSGALKLFLGSTLFIDGGCGYGNKTATHSEANSTYFTSWKESISVARIFGGLGNEWQWHTLFLSAEWIHFGYNMGLGPVTNNVPQNGEGGPLLPTTEASSLSKTAGSIEFGAMVSLGLAF